jgi:hypothetical protein
VAPHRRNQLGLLVHLRRQTVAFLVQVRDDAVQPRNLGVFFVGTPGIILRSSKSNSVRCGRACASDTKQQSTDHLNEAATRLARQGAACVLAVVRRLLLVWGVAARTL